LRRTGFIVKPRFAVVPIGLCVVVALGSAAWTRAAGPTVRVSDDKGTAVDVTGLTATDLAALAKLGARAEEWTPVFALYVEQTDGKDRQDQPALLGDYRIEGEVLRFTPRFPLARGVKYRAVLDVARIPARAGSTEKPVEVVLLLPKKEVPATLVERVYPTADTLPENLLRFYLHFSAPMGRGEAYRHIRLLNADGKVIEAAFLELGQELWDAQQKRFTLIIDPGRIKQGLKPREDLGPVLEAGKTYTLEIDRRWSDAEGQPLKATFRKTFRTTAPVEARLDAKSWKLTAPAAGTRAPLVVTFPKPLDHALLHRMVTVADAKGKAVDGTIAVTDKETCWRFTPQNNWSAGAFHLLADTQLEDLAGNNLARPFEVDIFRPVQGEIKVEQVKVPFEVKAPN
jgi:hypothetical protein